MLQATGVGLQTHCACRPGLRGARARRAGGAAGQGRAARRCRGRARRGRRRRAQRPRRRPGERPRGAQPRAARRRRGRAGRRGARPRRSAAAARGARQPNARLGRGGARMAARPAGAARAPRAPCERPSRLPLPLLRAPRCLLLRLTRRRLGCQTAATLLPCCARGALCQPRLPHARALLRVAAGVPGARLRRSHGDRRVGAAGGALGRSAAGRAAVPGGDGPARPPARRGRPPHPAGTAAARRGKPRAGMLRGCRVGAHASFCRCGLRLL